MAEEEHECECPAGIPAWVMTFADLMSLLMCFFVLLLSFSELDVVKYKQIAGSMQNAFGVQREINVKDVPKGTSIIAQEFSPGRPDPTPLNEVRQKTTDDSLSTLDVTPGDDSRQQSEDEKTMTEEEIEEKLKDYERELLKKTQAQAFELAAALREEILTGQLEIETIGKRIIIRVKEKNSFPSGSATLNEDFEPVMDKVREALVDTEGQITVSGHTDNLPIYTDRFRSNWELSSARAVSVAHELLIDGDIDAQRFLVVGHADTKPLVDNETPENRARNRRVEIELRQAEDPEYSPQALSLESEDITTTEENIP